MSRGILDKAVDRIFSMRKSVMALIVIFILGLVIRIIAAVNLRVYADDMHFVTHAINFISSGRLVTYDQSSGLWFSFTNIMYNLFGFTQLASRMAALIFGSLSIILIYFLAREFFDEKISIMSALLLAVSPFHIKGTMAEMDVMAMFFVIASALTFVRWLKNNRNIGLALSGIFMGLAIYTKVYPLLFIPSFILYWIYIKRKNGEKIMSRDNAKKAGIFLLCIFIFAVPALAHNYLLYQDKGFLDLQFTRTLGLGKEVSEQYYSWDMQFEAKNSWRGLILGDTKHIASGMPLLLAALNFVRIGDCVVFILGIIGIGAIFWRKEKRNYLYLAGLMCLFALPFLASIILLPKHFIFIDILLIPLGAYGLNEIIKLADKKTGIRNTKIIIGIVILSSLIYIGSPNLGEPFYGKSSIGQIIDFKDSSIAKGAMIVSDGRIYSGRMHWFSQGKPYLDGSTFIDALRQQENIEGSSINVEIYYVECVIDDCGWGTIKDQPEFNESMESLTQIFRQKGQLVKKIYEPRGGEYYLPIVIGEKTETINIYKMVIPLKSQVVQFALQPKSWFLYPIGYSPVESNFDYYDSYGFGKILNDFAHLVMKLAIALAFISIIYPFYVLFKDKNER